MRKFFIDYIAAVKFFMLEWTLPCQQIRHLHANRFQNFKKYRNLGRGDLFVLRTCLFKRILQLLHTSMHLSMMLTLASQSMYKTEDGDGEGGRIGEITGDKSSSGGI